MNCAEDQSRHRGKVLTAAVTTTGKDRMENHPMAKKRFLKSVTPLLFKGCGARDQHHNHIPIKSLEEILEIRGGDEPA